MRILAYPQDHVFLVIVMDIQIDVWMALEFVLIVSIILLERSVNTVKKDILEMPLMEPARCVTAHLQTALQLAVLKIMEKCSASAEKAIQEHAVKAVLLVILEIL